jgi:MFS family permease
MAAYYFSFLFTAPIVGEYAPKYGRKNIIVYGVLLMAFGTILFAVAAFCKNDAGFYAISFFGRFL